jgi:hypothetical protein
MRLGNVSTSHEGAIMNVLSIILLSIFVVIAIAHLVVAYFRIIKRRSGYSTVPFVNCVIGCIGMSMSGNSFAAALWWAPFVVDWGGLPMVIEMAVWKAVRRKPS